MADDIMSQADRERYYIAHLTAELERDGRDLNENDPMRDPWQCVACLEEHTFEEHYPLYLWGEDRPFRYCTTCVGRQFDNILEGIEKDGIPKIGEDVLHEMPEVMARLAPELKTRFWANLVRFHLSLEWRFSSTRQELTVGC